MENQFNNVPEKKLATNIQQKAKIGLPIIALALDFAPILFVFLASLHEAFLVLLLIGIFSPIIGIILGIIALCQGRKRIGTAGIIISIIAIILPIIFVITVILLLQTGAIVIGM